jgi:hypothetical protein
MIGYGSGFGGMGPLIAMQEMCGGRYEKNEKTGKNFRSGGKKKSNYSGKNENLARLRLRPKTARLKTQDLKT